MKKINYIWASFIFITRTFSNELLEFNYAELLDIENQIQAKENLFILYFDKRDGSTEIIHREFLKAAVMLKKDGVIINVLECNNKLSTRLEDRLQVFKYPKIKFYRLGNISQTYNGGMKAAHIGAWVRKTLRPSSTESTEIVSYEDFVKHLKNEDTKDYLFFYGLKDSEQFKIFERMARTKIVKFFWTSNVLLWKILEYMVENSSFNPKRFPEYDEEVHKTKALYEQRIFKNIQLEEESHDLIENKIFYVKKLRFAHEEIYLTDKLGSADFTALKSFVKKRFYTIIESVYGLKQSVESKTLEEEKTYLVFLYSRHNFYSIKENLKELIENFTKRFILAFVDLESGNNYIYLDILKYDKDSVFILEQKKNEQFIHKYKIEINYNQFFLETVKHFVNEYSHHRLTEYIKTKNAESITFKDSLFVEAVGSNYESLVYKNYQNVLTIFYKQDDAKVSFLMNLVKKYENLFYHYKFLRINIEENEVKENFKGKLLPVIKIYSGKNKASTKNISYTPDESMIVSFIKEIITSDEL